jgi:hypothetical protein
LDGIYIGTENGIYVFTTAPSVFPKVAAGETVSAVEEQSPAEFTVLSNYPNPFNPATTIEYSLTKTSTVRLAVYTSTGQLVRVLVNREQAPGGYTIKWDGSGMPSGVYLAELHASEQVKTVKMSLLK